MRLAPQMEDDRLLIVPADRRRIELEHVASCGALHRGVERNSTYQLVQIDGQLPATIKRLITHPKMATSGKT